jgi:hypothetical protein
MNLRYIALHMDFDSGYKDPFRDNFNLNSRFISNYLSTQIRKLKVETDETFNMISVAPSIEIAHVFRIVGEKALQARISFNKEAYEQMSEIEKYKYYLQLLEEGYKIFAKHKKIPLEQLLKLHQDFKNNGYRNEWLHKKKKFKEQGIEVTLNCFFTSFDFHLVMSVSDIRSKMELISGTVIRTLPDEVCFAHFFKDVIIENDKLSITEFQDRPKFIFNLTDVFNKKFTFEVSDVGVEYKPLPLA